MAHHQPEPASDGGWVIPKPKAKPNAKPKPQDIMENFLEIVANYKVRPCEKPDGHDYYRCFDYHSDAYRRRSPLVNKRRSPPWAYAATSRIRSDPVL